MSLVIICGATATGKSDLAISVAKEINAEIVNAVADLNTQSKTIQARLAGEKIKVSADKEIIALIAYLQRLGTDISKK